mmetsp:Transcript_9877/g.21948  ORF Transcript_9877/g.21948 Transcript_9877/m.21948 type:complete len:246 (+) Transcript_9877:1437-2174(+)
MVSGIRRHSSSGSGVPRSDRTARARIGACMKCWPSISSASSTGALTHRGTSSSSCRTWRSWSHWAHLSSLRSARLLSVSVTRCFQNRRRSLGESAAISVLPSAITATRSSSIASVMYSPGRDAAPPASLASRSRHEGCALAPSPPAGASAAPPLKASAPHARTAAAASTRGSTRHFATAFSTAPNASASTRGFADSLNHGALLSPSRSWSRLSLPHTDSERDSPEAGPLVPEAGPEARPEAGSSS